MIEAIRPDSLQSKQMLQGWSLSVLFHLAVVVALGVMMPNMRIVLEQPPFTWEVALVEPSSEAVSQAPASVPDQVPPPRTARVEPARPPAPPQAPPIEPAPETVMPRVAPQQSQAMLHPAIEPTKPQPSVQPAPPVQDMVQAPVKPPEPQEIKKAEVTEPEPVVQEAVKQESEPVREAPPVMEPAAPAYAYQAPAPAPSQPPAEAHHESVPDASAPAAQAADAAPAGPAPAVQAPKRSDAPPAETAPAEAPPHIAKAAPPSSPQASAAKPDHRWVGESLWRRVAELKRYPSSARLNGLEGRVVLKAVIRADGHLAEVSIVKSSGHAVLDTAAMEAVKLACPLHMKQPIGPPQIVVSLPIVYSLAN